MRTLADLFADKDEAHGAVVLPGDGTEIRYGALADQIEQLAGQLRDSGLQPGQTVALALPNGIEFLAAFLATTRAGLVAAPLNDALGVEELRFLLESSEAGVVITTPAASQVQEAAAAWNLPVWTARRTASGSVELAGRELAAPGAEVPDVPSSEDVAVLLHTSGTTSQPKGVPLTHANVMASLHNIATHYALGPSDTGLVVMPLFHGHGLIGAALCSLYAGARIVLPERFSAHAFWPLVAAHAVTWYSAVPTIHEILLVRADADHAPARSGLRFVRSCSSALSPATLKRLEDRFAAPVIEAYAMTETTHQATSNPLPPGVRKPGTVGPGTNVEIAILGEGGKLLDAEAEGEIVVRGATVMRAYAHDPEATREAFSDGWYRTGDLGILDRAGYLRVTGRIKELINRGGEKISPTHVDAVLMGHPAIAMAASFGVPDPIYGEEIHAAVVLRAAATAEELQAYCRKHLSAFETPKVIHIVDELPKNAAGKLDRRRLTQLFKR